MGGFRLHPDLPLAFISPAGSMFHDPIEERFFEADIGPGFFALDPLVLQNLFTLRKEFLVENGVLNELRRRLRNSHVVTVFHIGKVGQSKPGSVI